jgi:glycogen synthase
LEAPTSLPEIVGMKKTEQTSNSTYNFLTLTTSEKAIITAVNPTDLINNKITASNHSLHQLFHKSNRQMKNFVNFIIITVYIDKYEKHSLPHAYHGILWHDRGRTLLPQKRTLFRERF